LGLTIRKLALALLVGPPRTLQEFRTGDRRADYNGRDHIAAERKLYQWMAAKTHPDYQDVEKLAEALGVGTEVICEGVPDREQVLAEGGPNALVQVTDARFHLKSRTVEMAYWTIKFYWPEFLSYAKRIRFGCRSLATS
jgi:hypothetical protein